MPLHRSVAIFLASQLALTASAADNAVAIRHDPVACVVAERFTRLESRFEPADQLARGRVYFRAEGGQYWYYVELKAEAGAFYGVLPKVKKGVKKVDYYVDAMDRAFAEGRTAEFDPIVVDDGGQCKDKLVAAILPAAKVVVGAPAGAPPIPFGFEAAGIEAGGAAGASPEASAAPRKGGGKTVWLVLGGAAVAGGVAAAAAGGGSSYGKGSSSAPVTASIASIAPSGTALAGATVLTFTASSSAGSAATFQWDFGDGASGSGATATHVYAQEGSFTVALRASYAGGSGSASASVSARSLTGHWLDSGPPLETDDLTQAGASVSGTNVVGSNRRSLSGSVANPRAVSWTRFDSGQPDERLDLTANDSITQLTGTVTKIRDGSQKPVTLNRQ